MFKELDYTNVGLLMLHMMFYDKNARSFHYFPDNESYEILKFWFIYKNV